MTLEYKLNLLPANGLEANLRPSPRRSLAVRVITYSLAALLSFVAAYGLSGCNDDDYTPNKYSYTLGLDNCESKSTFYGDADHDGYGNPNITTQACTAPYGYVTDNTDCNDGNARVNPGMIEVPYNGVDDDCNSTTLDDDLDQDGYSTLTGTIDCDDNNADVYPNAPELCDLVDNQCPGDVGHGMVDEGFLPSGLTGRIAFVSSLFSSHGMPMVSDIHVTNADGSNQINLTNTTSFLEESPAWSPGGTDIAFGSVRTPGEYGSDPWEISVINTDGSNRRQVSHVRDYYASYFGGLNPVWSNGNKIAFSTSSGCNSRLGIYTVNVDGTAQTKLINLPSCDSYPPIAWSPDGSEIAVPALGDLLIINPNGSLKEILSMPSGNNPAWSPDGKLAFDSGGDIYTVDANGANPTKLAQNGERPSWSHDGKMIAFFSNRDGNWEIYVIKKDGSDPTNITNNPANDAYPGRPGWDWWWSPSYKLSWSADDKYITFMSDRTGNWEIYVANSIDGRNPTNISNNPTMMNLEPVWSP